VVDVVKIVINIILSLAPAMVGDKLNSALVLPEKFKEVFAREQR